MVGHGEQRGVAVADVPDRLRVVFHHPVIRPVVDRPVPVVAIQVQVLPDDVERLVGVEQLDLEEPVVAPVVVVKPADGVLDAARAGEVGLFPLGQAVEVVLGSIRVAAERRRERREVDPADPEVVLLAALELPGVEAIVVPLAAQIEVVVVVGDEVGKDRPRLDLPKQVG
jgi:hypothetical protein